MNNARARTPNPLSVAAPRTRTAGSARDSKRHLRAMARRRLAGISPQEREECSARVCALLTKSRLWGISDQVCSYLPLGDEIDISAANVRALREGKQLALPHPGGECAYCAASLESGTVGVRGDAGGDRVTIGAGGALVLMPGLLFSHNGTRLGRGGGWFDRTLSETVGAGVVLVGVCYHQIIVSYLPRHAHDCVCGYLVSERALWVPGD